MYLVVIIRDDGDDDMPPIAIFIFMFSSQACRFTLTVVFCGWKSSSSSSSLFQNMQKEINMYILCTHAADACDCPTIDIINNFRFAKSFQR